MKRRTKNSAKNKRHKPRKKSRGKNRAANFAGALVLEVVGMLLLLTLFFTFRESPAEYNARIENESSEPQIEVVQHEFESYVAGLFEQKYER